MLPDQVFYHAPERSLLDFAEGGFARRVLVVAAQEVREPVYREFLLKILAAAQLHLEKDLLLAVLPDAEPVALLPALREKHPEHVLVFGFAPAQLGLHLETVLYRPFAFYGTSLLFSESLAVLEPDKIKKSQLWRALQTMFLT